MREKIEMYREIFLGGGSVGDPTKSYHMEFVTSDDDDLT